MAKSKTKKTAPKKAVKKTSAKKKPAAKAKKPAKKTAKKVATKKVAVKKKPAAKKASPKTKTIIKKPIRKVEKSKVIVKKKVEKKAVAVKQVEPPRVLRVPIAPTGRPVVAVAPKPSTDDRSKYSEAELKEFEQLILAKLEKAKMEFRILKETLNKTNDSGTDSTSGGNTKVLEDGADTAEKENLSQLAARQQKFIGNLENALIRIKNGTYGICSVTGRLISKERLLAVPHTTLSIEAKIMQTD